MPSDEVFTACCPRWQSCTDEQRCSEVVALVSHQSTVGQVGNNSATTMVLLQLPWVVHSCSLTLYARHPTWDS